MKSSKEQKVDDKKKKIDESITKDKSSTKENNINALNDKDRNIIDVDQYQKRSFEHVDDAKNENHLSKKQKKEHNKDFFDKTNKSSSNGIHHITQPKLNEQHKEKEVIEVVTEGQKNKTNNINKTLNSKGPDFKITKVNPLLLDSGNAKSNTNEKLVSVLPKLPDINNSYEINNNRIRNDSTKPNESIENTDEISQQSKHIKYITFKYNIF